MVMGEAKRRKRLDPNFGSMSQSDDLEHAFRDFVKQDHEYLMDKIKKFGSCVRFFKYNGVVYTNNTLSSNRYLSGMKHFIVQANQCDRYTTDFKSIINAAINDLRDREDGIYYFYDLKWHRENLPVYFEQFICESDTPLDRYLRR